MRHLLLALLLFLQACSHSAPNTDTKPEADLGQSGDTLIESDKLWELISSGVENSPEIRYARRIGAKLETNFKAKLGAASAVTATPPAKCTKLPPIDVVVTPEGKISRANNRARSCWVNGTNMAIKVSKELLLDAPPAGLLKDGHFKFSWTPDLPEKRAADKEPVTN